MIIDTEENIPLESSQKVIIAGLKGLELFCFFLASLFIFFLYAIIFRIDSYFGWIFLILIILLSTIILKGFLFFKKTSKNYSLKASIIGLNQQLSSMNIGSLKKLVISIRFITFNILFEMFPLVLISFSLIIGFVIIESLTYPLCHINAFSVLLSNTSTSESVNMFSILELAIIPVFGVLLAMFQYYLEKQEKSAEKFLQKYLLSLNRFTQETLEYNEYLDWLKTQQNYDSQALYNRLKIITSPQQVLYQGLEFYSSILSQKTDEEKNETIKNLNSLFKQGIPNIIINNTVTSSDQKYKQIESALSLPGNKQNQKELYKSYALFFSSKREDLIIDKMRELYDFDEIGRILMTNINLFIDEIPKYTNTDFFNSAINTLSIPKKDRLDAIENMSQMPSIEYPEIPASKYTLQVLKQVSVRILNEMLMD